MSYKFSSICLKCSLLSTFLLIFQSIFAQTNFQDVDQEIQSKQKLLGKDLVVMLWKAGDTVVYKKEVGEFNSKTAAPIGSCSKWLTAALVMQFVDEGKLSLDDKVSRWLPEFERYGKNYITIGICLSHLTGIKDDVNFIGKVFQKRKATSLEEAVNDFAAKEIRINPGNDFWYGNMGIDIAGRVLEVIAKKKFDVLIKQKLFNPMAMRRTTFATLDASAISPSNGASATADDYIKFLGMLMNKGKANGKQILSEESVELLRTIQTKSMKMAYVPKPMEGNSYALGAWVVEEKDGKGTVMINPGFYGPWAMIDLCRGYGCFVLTKELLTEEKPGIHMELKRVIDEHFPACQ